MKSAAKRPINIVATNANNGNIARFNESLT